MATTTGQRLTKAGEALLAKIHLGNQKLELTSFVLGDSVWTDDEIEAATYTSLKNERLRLQVDEIVNGTGSEAGRTICTGVLQNTNVTEAFYVREIGLMAKNPDSGEEILYTIDPIAKDAPTTVIEANSVTQNVPIRIELIAVSRDQVEIILTDSAELVTKTQMEDELTKLSESISLSGNAATATKLATARTIGISGAATGTATSFNGSANITIPVTGLNASNLTSGTVPSARMSGAYAISISGNAATATSATSATSASTAAQLTTARTIALSGAASGTATSFNGTANITIPVTALNASNLTSGTVPAARLSFATSSEAQAGTASNKIMSPENVSDWIERRPQSIPKITSFLQGLMDRTIGVGVYSYNNSDTVDLSDIIPGSASGLIVIHKRNDDIGNTPATYGNWSIECHSASGIIYTKWVDIAVGESSWREVWSEKLPYSTLTSNGWCKLPNGLILQWGYGSMTGTKSFPVAFPNAALVAVASDYQGLTAVGINADTNSTFIIYSTADAIAYKYIAIGY